MKHLFCIVSLVFTGATLASGILTESDAKVLGVCPPELKDVTKVFQAQFDFGTFKKYSVPKAEDPKDAVYAVEWVTEGFYMKGPSITLPDSLGEMLREPSRESASDIVLLAPFLLIAEDSAGKLWLITVRRQDGYVSVVPLRSLGTTPPMDSLYWAFHDDGCYLGRSGTLQRILTDREQKH